VALVRAGEQSGTLTDVLDELSENLKWQDEIASQARRAMTYPVIVLAVIVAVVFVLMTLLVPQLAATFKTLVPKLPRETEILVSISSVFVRWWYLLLGIPPRSPSARGSSPEPTTARSAALDGFRCGCRCSGPSARRSSSRASRPSSRCSTAPASACSSASRSARRSSATA
jgi:hypothetical protein